MTLVVMLLAACSTSVSPSPSVSVGPSPTPRPTPSPAPTPLFSNVPDADLRALIPTEINGAVVVIPPAGSFAVTPGDIGQAAFGDLGDRFSSLVLAYVVNPRLSLYAMRVSGRPARTSDLEPYLGLAAQYVGNASTDLGSWALGDVGGHQVWSRPGDDATRTGSTIYTWASGDYVFLLIGVNTDTNVALITALPGEPAPTPVPSPSAATSPAGG